MKFLLAGIGLFCWASVFAADAAKIELRLVHPDNERIIEEIKAASAGGTLSGVPAGYEYIQTDDGMFIVEKEPCLKINQLEKVKVISRMFPPSGGKGLGPVLRQVEYIVFVILNAADRAAFAKITEVHCRRLLAIFCKGRFMAAPRIVDTITTGNLQIYSGPDQAVAAAVAESLE